MYFILSTIRIEQLFFDTIKSVALEEVANTSVRKSDKPVHLFATLRALVEDGENIFGSEAETSR